LFLPLRQKPRFNFSKGSWFYAGRSVRIQAHKITIEHCRICSHLLRGETNPSKL